MKSDNDWRNAAGIESSPGGHDPLEYWDRLPDQLGQLQGRLLLGMHGSRSVDGEPQPDLGQIVEDLVRLAGAIVWALLRLATWPLRYAWRRTRQQG